MEEEKIKKINDFGSLLHDVLWTEKSKNKKVLNELKDLILVKKKLDFTKEEFVQEIFLDDTLFPHFPVEDYDEIQEYEFTFYLDSYDAVINKNDFTVIVYLEERIDEFHLLLDETYGVDNVISYNK